RAVTRRRARRRRPQWRGGSPVPLLAQGLRGGAADVRIRRIEGRLQGGAGRRVGEVAERFRGGLPDVLLGVVDQRAQGRNRRDDVALAGHLGRPLPHVRILILHQGDQGRLGDGSVEVLERVQGLLAYVAGGVSQRRRDRARGALVSQIP